MDPMACLSDNFILLVHVVCKGRVFKRMNQPQFKHKTNDL